MTLPSSPLPEDLGFRNGLHGTHTSRTMMLAELTALLAAVPMDAPYERYVEAITEQNVLGKATTATRVESARRVRELYAMEPSVGLFATLRRLWCADEAGRPLLACLCANARDPLLRMTASAVFGLCEGETLRADEVKEAVRAHTGSRLNETSLDNTTRHARASWTQSGHLRGRTPKVRSKAVATPAAAAYALYIGHQAGLRGATLLDSFWVRLLDSTQSETDELAFQASRRGWITYRRIGDVVEVGVLGLEQAVDRGPYGGQD